LLAGALPSPAEAAGRKLQRKVSWQKMLWGHFLPVRTEEDFAMIKE